VKVLIAHPGTRGQSSHHLAYQLHKNTLLTGLHTGFAFNVAGWGNTVIGKLPNDLRRWIGNRQIEGVPSNKLHSYPIGELRERWQTLCGKPVQAATHCRNEQFQEAIPDRAITSVHAVIGYDTSSWILADRCAQHKIPLVLNQTTWHPDAKRKVFERIKEQFSNWVEGVEHRLSEVRIAEEKEYEGARLIVTCSSPGRQSLIDNGIPPAKVHVIPYGMDCGQFFPMKGGESRKFRFVFTGGINAFKGIPILLEAWRRLAPRNAELWLVGPVSKEILKHIPKLPGLHYLGVVAHSELPALLQQCDVFVFPSYFEGFGIVILEAMASGLPVLTTTATGGLDIIADGQDGWVIEPGDVEQLVELMDECLSDQDKVREMGRCARKTAERFTWAEHGRRWVDLLTSLEKV
jgi:starch synthase